jgi:hypothetical protein
VAHPCARQGERLLLSGFNPLASVPDKGNHRGFQAFRYHRPGWSPRRPPSENQGVNDVDPAKIQTEVFIPVDLLRRRGRSLGIAVAGCKALRRLIFGRAGDAEIIAEISAGAGLYGRRAGLDPILCRVAVQDSRSPPEELAKEFNDGRAADVLTPGTLGLSERQPAWRQALMVHRCGCWIFAAGRRN